MSKNIRFTFILLAFLVSSQIASAQALMHPFMVNKSDAQMAAEEQSAKQFFVHVTDDASPMKYDLLQYQSPVKDQGHRGTCVAFASMALVESLYKVKSGQTVDLSEQYAYWESKYFYQNDPDPGYSPHSEGSEPVNLLKAVAAHGVPMQQAWVYEKTAWYDDPTHPDCVKANTANPNKMPTSCLTNGDAPGSAQSSQKIAVINPHNVPSSSTSIMGFLQAGVAVEIGIDVYDAAWSYSNKNSPRYATGTVLMPTAGDKIVGGHAVLIVGYDRTQQVYLFKNSWGTSTWASKSPVPGFGTLPFNYVKKFATATVAQLPQ